MGTTYTPMQKIGTAVRLAGGGGFDVRGCPEPQALTETIVRACNAHEQLVDAVKMQHKAIDILMARIIGLDSTFKPSQSAIWPAVIAGSQALAAVGAA